MVFTSAVGYERYVPFSCHKNQGANYIDISGSGEKHLPKIEIQIMTKGSQNKRRGIKLSSRNQI